MHKDSQTQEVGFAEHVEKDSWEPAQRTTSSWLPDVPAEALHEAIHQEPCQLGLWTTWGQEALMAGEPERGSHLSSTQAGPWLPCPEAFHCVK